MRTGTDSEHTKSLLEGICLKELRKTKNWPRFSTVPVSILSVYPLRSFKVQISEMKLLWSCCELEKFGEKL
jgi:hypothetical protein